MYYFDGSVNSFGVVANKDKWNLYIIDQNITTGDANVYLNGDNLLGTVNAGLVNDISFWGRYSSQYNYVGAIDQLLFFDNVILNGTQRNDLYNSGVVRSYEDLTGSESFYSDIFFWLDFDEQDISLIGQDKSGNGRELGYVGFVEGDLVGGKDSLDLTEVSITSANAVTGHIEGNAAGWDGVTKWADRSGNGNDATQTTLADTPYWFADQVNTTEDVVSYNGSTQHSEVGAGVINHFDTGGWLHLVFEPTAAMTTGDTVLDAYTNGWKITLDDISGGLARVRFIKKASTTDGEWRTDVRVIAVDSVAVIQINYDSSDGVTGDPVFYYNGLLLGTTEVVAPVGTLDSTESGNIIIGESIGGSNGYEGNLLQWAVTGE